MLNSAGQAALTTPIPPGTHTVTAVYGGDAAFLDSNVAAVAATVNPDVTSQFIILPLRAQAVGAAHFRQRMFFLNIGPNAVPGPVGLVLDGLPAGVRLRSSPIVTVAHPPLHSPVAVVNLHGSLTLAPGVVSEVDLDFLAPSAGAVHFRPRLLAGVLPF